MSHVMAEAYVVAAKGPQYEVIGMRTISQKAGSKLAIFFFKISSTVQAYIDNLPIFNSCL